MWGRLDFLAGFLAGWIVTTEEGKKTANDVLNKAVKLAKDTLSSNKAENS